MSGRLTIWIDGREALPVRAIPYVAGWGHSADRVAQYLAQWNELNGKPRFPNLTAYQRRGKTVAPVLPGDFDRDVWKQRALEEKLKREYPNLDGDAPNPEGASRFDDESINLLPTGVFVWLDEFASIYQREGKGGEFRLAPMRGEEVKALALEGFDDCPRRGPDADRAMIDYADFVAICQVDDPKNFGGFRVEANGLYVDLPPSDATLTPEERAAVTWHPTGQYDKPALPLPCTLGQLRAFLPDAGMAGYIDEEAVDAVLGEHEHRIGWYDNTMNAAMWFKRASVKPDEAAMLLCRIDPLERDWQGNAPDPERIYVDDDKASPDRYRLLLRAFLDVAETDPKPRTLLDWRDVAKREGLRHHQWTDEYVQVRIEELPADSDSGGGTVKVGAGATASDVPPLLQKSATGKPATQEEIVKAFPIEGGWGDKLKKAPSGAYKWLDGTWAHVGSQKPGDATTYYPVKVAIALAASNPQRMTLAACDLAIKRLFPKWWDEWESKSELLRNI